MSDYSAGACIIAKEALPPSGRWCKTPEKKIRINGVRKLTCFDVRPNYDVRKKLGTQAM
jgi:hypothetical protein